MRVLVRRRRPCTIRRVYRVLLFLVRQLDVQEGRDGLDGSRVLRVVQEVSHAGLERSVPLEDIELGVDEGLGLLKG